SKVKALTVDIQRKDAKSNNVLQTWSIEEMFHSYSFFGGGAEVVEDSDISFILVLRDTNRP
ncbi:hypothetical protein ACTXJT_12650, partial [Corynebacterium casei]|uniref:hypothetical protein n=1 Tax=Corynebacterium casei TaxID=160386 RepID=UPI003FD44EDA